MVNSNEFKGARLAEAVRQATAAYRWDSPRLECKDACTDLALDLADFKREAARALDSAEELMRQSERLADAARRDALQAVVNSAIAAAGAFGSAARALRILKGLRFNELSRRDWIGLIPLVGGGFLAGANALDAIKNSDEARRLAQNAERDYRNADRLGDEIVRIAEEYRRSNCGSSNRVS